MNHYEFLGVSRDAGDDEIKNAYKRMAKKYHPDVTEGSACYAHEKMQRINAAYDVLSSNALREEYDYSLWLEERASRDAEYVSEFGSYVPRNSRVNPVEEPTPWQKFYKKAGKPKFAAFKRSHKTIIIFRVLRIILPAIMLVIILGIITNAAYIANTLDRIYGRGTPAKVTAMFFDSIKDDDFKQAAIYTRSTFEQFTANLSRVYGFVHDGIPFGSIWFADNTQELRVKVLGTERFSFGSANVTIEITNLNTEKIFVLAEHRIKEDLQRRTSKWILLQAISEKNLSLVAQVYEEYINDIMSEMPNEYLSATVVLKFTRPFNNWYITSADDINALRNVILGGFGQREPADYITIDWLDVLYIT
jgi:curved DNA-binding protein CbpA